MSDASLSSEQPGTPEQVVTAGQSGTQAFPIIVSATPAEPPAATELAIHEPSDAIADPSEAFALGDELTPNQQRVLQQLVVGISISQTSKTTGVPVRSISRWANHDPKFIAARNAWGREQLESGKASALAMTGDIAATLHSAVRQGNANIAYRMADKMGMLKVSNPGPIDAGEVERRHRIREAQVRDELSQAEYQHDLDLHDRAEKEGVAWASWASRALTFHEQRLLKFLRDKSGGRASGGLILLSKRQLSDLLRQAGVPEDAATRLLASYRRPYPGFYEPDDLPYGEDEETAAAPSEQPAEVQAEQQHTQNAGATMAPDVGM